MELRPYQRETIKEAYKSIKNKQKPCIVLPTGAGKSIVQASIVQDAAAKGVNILCATHVKELIEQNYLEFLGIEKDILSGIYSAGLNRRDTMAQVCFAGVQSLGEKIYDHHVYGLLMIDEAHLISPKDGTRYQKLIERMLAINPDLKIIGMTATPYRMDQGYLTSGKSAIFTELIEAQGSSLQDLINDKYLSSIRTKNGSQKADMDGVKKRGGEYIEKEMQERFEKQELVQACVADAIREGAGRKGWLFFAASIKNAEEILAELKEHCINCALIIGGTPKEERAGILERYKQQKIQALVSVGVLTTGFNARHVDLIVLMRATESVALYVQMVGRGTRTADGKTDCLVLDYGENVQRHGCVDRPLIYDKNKSEEKGDAPTKECPDCMELIFAGLRVCPLCGFEFPPPVAKIIKTAESGAILADQERVEISAVDDVLYSLNKGWRGKKDTLKIIYIIGLKQVHEYVCLGHDGYARRKAVEFWRMRIDSEPPDNASSGFLLAHTLKKPIAIHWKKDGKYFRITKHIFKGENE